MKHLKHVFVYTLSLCSIVAGFFAANTAIAQPTQTRYFAHDAVEDSHGVIAPWYKGLNGQCDFRVRVAAETLKRYPWATNPKTGLPAPDYMYNGRWEIKADGTIRPRKLEDWGNGDLAQRGAYAMIGWVDYYRYSGDPAAIAHISMIADVLLNHCQTSEDHPWPRFLISVPNRGDPYGECNPHGMIQLDLVGLFGIGLVRGYQITGNEEWLGAAKRWADLLAARRDRRPGMSPWNRYANPEDVFWDDRQTGGVVVLLRLFDELIRVGYTGANDALIEARDAGRAYLRDVLLPRWLENDAFGRDYWDWPHPVQSETLSEMVPRYMMANPDTFPNWRPDARNIMSLFLQRACVAPESNGDVYSGAWAYPEGAQCCGRSLSYPPMQVGAAFAEYGVRADSQWARELARRQFILATYDAHETGVVEDGMDGGDVVAGSWLQIAHPLPLTYVLDAMAWLPDVLGPNRENHIVRSTSVVSKVVYGAGRIRYTTFDAPKGTQDVLRLAFRPGRILADGQPLQERLDGTGYGVKALPNGDCVVTIRHEGSRTVIVEGADPQQQVEEPVMTFAGGWEEHKNGEHFGGTARVTHETGADASFTFEGSQFRLIGAAGPDGGLADVYIDDVRQLCGIDCWNPNSLRQQVLYSRSGLSHGPHTIKVVALGKGNPRSRGADICVDAIQFSAATGDAGFGEGGGPTDAQRWIFGYPGREDYVDSQGRAWRPATEAVIRVGEKTDPVEACWYTIPRRQAVANTQDPVLYHHGMHGKDFTAYVTVGPGTYHVRVKLMESRWIEPSKRLMHIDINGRAMVRNLDIAATAAGRPAAVSFTANQTKIWEGLNRAVDLVFNDIQPRHGVIAVRFLGVADAEAVVSAIEVGPGEGDPGAKPIAAASQSAPALGGASGEVLLFSFFRNNGEDGLYLAWSEDGHRWRPLNGDRPLLRPEAGPKPLMRDPCLVRAPDGTFHMVWTTSWSQPPLVGYAHSSDLRTWSPQQAIPVMAHEPATLNVWAPELFHDAERDRFLIYWSSTIPGRFTDTQDGGDLSREGHRYNHRFYWTATRDFMSFEPTRLLYDPGFNCIDASIFKADDRYCLILKDETVVPVRKHLRMAFARSPEGPWQDLTRPFTIAWVEGPSAIQIGELYYVYFDHYTEPQYYGAVRSKDLRTWEDVSQQLEFPKGARHGSVLRVPRSVIIPLMDN